ncbi:MAG: MFS transporter [Armatimonadota bacterium]
MEDSLLTSEESSRDPIEVRRNFKYLSIDVIFYIFALAFIDQSTVLPAFLETLTKSTVIIGAITAIRPAGTLIPPFWTAHYLRNRSRHKSFLMKVATVSRISIALFAIVLFISGPSDKNLILVSFLIMYTAFWVSEGYASVPWTDLVAKTIPEKLRGRLFGLTQFGGGILAIFAGIIISRVLVAKGLTYPGNYAILITIAALFFALSLLSLSKVREPEGITEEHDDDFLTYTKNIGMMISGHSQLKRFLLVQLLMGFFGMSLPFYILYAKKIGSMSGGEVGILLAVQTAGSILFSAAAGYASDNHGPKIVIVWSIIAAISAQILALLINIPSFYLYCVLFFIIGAVLGSMWIGLTNFLLEMAEESQRKAYIGLMNTANAPTLIFPIIGGLVIESFSYQAVFAVTGITAIIALILTSGMIPKFR